MVDRVFHDAVIDRLVRTPTTLEAACSMVSVYEGDSLIRQESGMLRITGQVPAGASEPAAESESGYDDACILDLNVKEGVVNMLVEWENYSTDATEVHLYTRTLGTMQWEPEHGRTVVLAKRS